MDEKLLQFLAIGMSPLLSSIARAQAENQKIAVEVHWYYLEYPYASIVKACSTLVSHFPDRASDTLYRLLMDRQLYQYGGRYKREFEEILKAIQ